VKIPGTFLAPGVEIIVARVSGFSCCSDEGVAQLVRFERPAEPAPTMMM
jgi:hypothetical protein